MEDYDSEEKCYQGETGVYIRDNVNPMESNPSEAEAIEEFGVGPPIKRRGRPSKEKGIIDVEKFEDLCRIFGV